MDWGTIANIGMQIASQYGKTQQGKAKGAVDQAGVTQSQDRNAIANYIAQQNAQNAGAQTDLDRQKFTQSSRGTDARQAIIGALMGNFSPTGALSGGLAKGMGTPEARASMKELNRQGLQAQFEPKAFTGGQMVTPPKLTSLPNVGGNNLMNTLAQLAQLAGSGYSQYQASKKDGE